MSSLRLAPATHSASFKHTFTSPALRIRGRASAEGWQKAGFRNHSERRTRLAAGPAFRRTRQYGDCASPVPCPRADERAQRPALGRSGCRSARRRGRTPDSRGGPRTRRPGQAGGWAPGRGAAVREREGYPGPARPPAGERPPIPPGLRRFRRRRGLPGRRGRRAVGPHVEGTGGRDARGGGRLGEDGDRAPQPRAPGSLPPRPRPPRSGRGHTCPAGNLRSAVRPVSAWEPARGPGTRWRPHAAASDSALWRDSCRAATLETTA